MLLGFLLPLLRRFTARTRMLIAAAIITAGVVLALALVLQGHAHRQNALAIRFGLLLVLAGLGLLVSGIVTSRRARRHHDAGTGQADDQP